MREERRSEPRRGLSTRVGLVLAATGIMSATVDARALADRVPDWRDTIGFGVAIALLAAASFRRPLAPALPDLRLAAARHLQPLALGALALGSPLALWIGGARTLGPALWLAVALALGAALWALADRRRAHPSDRLRRAGYAIVAIALAGASAARTLSIAGPGAVLLDAVTLAAVVVLVGLAYLRIRPALRDALAASAALAAFALLGVAYVAGTTYGNDAVAAPHQAALLLLAGRHPYASFDAAEALARFGLDPALATHLEDGGIVRGYSYPALSFLYVAPFVWAGLGDVRWLDLAVVLAIATLASRAARAGWRPMVLATVIGSEVVVRQSILAGVDPLWALLLAAAWLARRSAWSAPLLGLALADRQLAWFAFPFVLVAYAERGGARVALRRAGMALGVALLVQLPFLATAPAATLEGILAPLLAPIVSDGVGLMQLGVTDRYTPLLPRAAFTLASVAVLALLLTAAWRRARGLAGAWLAWPFVPLFFAWRSLQNYFAFMPLLALVADDEVASERSGAADAPDGPAHPH